MGARPINKEISRVSLGCFTTYSLNKNYILFCKYNTHRSRLWTCSIYNTIHNYRISYQTFQQSSLFYMPSDDLQTRRTDPHLIGELQQVFNIKKSFHRILPTDSMPFFKKTFYGSCKAREPL